MVPIFLGSESTSKGPPLIHPGWEQHSGVRMVCSWPLQPREEALGSSYIMGSVPYKGESIAPVVRLDANETLRDANDFPTKSSGLELKGCVTKSTDC